MRKIDTLRDALRALTTEQVRLAHYATLWGSGGRNRVSTRGEEGKAEALNQMCSTGLAILTPRAGTYRLLGPLVEWRREFKRRGLRLARLVKGMDRARFTGWGGAPDSFAVVRVDGDQAESLRRWAERHGAKIGYLSGEEVAGER